MDTNINSVLLEALSWIWVTCFGFIFHVYKRISSVEISNRVLEEVQRHHEIQRKEDQVRFETHRKETMARISEHHRIVMQKLDKIEGRNNRG